MDENKHILRQKVDHVYMDGFTLASKDHLPLDDDKALAVIEREKGQGGPVHEILQSFENGYFDALGMVEGWEGVFTSVYHGVRLLDHASPMWWDMPLINLDKLDMASPQVDVLGQLYGSYPHGLEALGLDYHTSFHYGFSHMKNGSGKSVPMYSTGDLTNVWGMVIRWRRANPVTYKTDPL